MDGEEINLRCWLECEPAVNDTQIPTHTYRPIHNYVTWRNQIYANSTGDSTAYIYISSLNPKRNDSNAQNWNTQTHILQYEPVLFCTLCIVFASSVTWIHNNAQWPILIQWDSLSPKRKSIAVTAGYENSKNSNISHFHYILYYILIWRKFENVRWPQCSCHLMPTWWLNPSTLGYAWTMVETPDPNRSMAN